MPATVKTAKSEARLNFRLPAKLKKDIETAAIVAGQTLSDFAIAALARTARETIEKERVTRLTLRDWRRFCRLLDDKSAKPNAALRKAAAEYKKHFGVANGSA